MDGGTDRRTDGWQVYPAVKEKSPWLHLGSSYTFGHGNVYAESEILLGAQEYLGLCVYCPLHLKANKAAEGRGSRVVSHIKRELLFLLTLLTPSERLSGAG